MPQNKGVFVGSIAFDYLMRFPGRFTEHILPDQLDRLSLSFLVEDMRKEHGGVAANIAYTFARLGGDSLLVGTVGHDFRDYEKRLIESGIDVSGVRVIEDKFTGSFFCNTDVENRQIAAFYAGAMGDAATISLKEFDRSDWAFVMISPTAPDAMQKAVRECVALDVPYVYDSSQQTVRLSGEELLEGIEHSSMLIVNDYELGLITKKTGKSLNDIIEMDGTIIVTRGASGVSIYHPEQDDIAAVPETEILDPTGVGDAFRGGFMCAHVAGADAVTAAQVGSVAATYCLEWVGTQRHKFTIDEFIERGHATYGNRDEVERLFPKPVAAS